jgi:ferric hydroxamate transport system substrate-binding protein
MSRLTRRQCLVFLAGLAISGSARSNSGHAAGQRVVSLTWPATQTLLTIGVQPVATVDRGEYGKLGLQPALPASTLELGRYAEPNLELLSELKPELILIDPDQIALSRTLERIAAVQVVAINTAEGTPYQKARELTLALGSQFDKDRAARDYVDRLDRQFRETRATLSHTSLIPTFVADLGADGRHVSIYASGSILNDVMQQLGIPNAWTGTANSWGFVSTGVEALATARNGRLLYIDRGMLTQQALAMLSGNPLWSSLPFVRSGRIAPLGGIYPFGGLPVAQQMLTDISQILDRESGRHG